MTTEHNADDVRPWIRQWAEDPEGGGAEWRTEARDKLLTHDPMCRSLDHPWLPRNKGRSCPSDFFWCEGCGVAFFNEGSYGYPDWLCDCCAKSRDAHIDGLDDAGKLGS